MKLAKTVPRRYIASRFGVSPSIGLRPAAQTQSQRNWSEWNRMIFGFPPGLPGTGAGADAAREAATVIVGTAAARTEDLRKSRRVLPALDCPPS